MNRNQKQMEANPTVPASTAPKHRELTLWSTSKGMDFHHLRKKKKGMDFHHLKRNDLQRLCKMNKIPAKMTNESMADSLSSLNTVMRKAESDKALERRNLRKKSVSKAFQIESTQEKESIAPCVKSKNMKGVLGILPSPSPSEKVVTPTRILNLDIIFMILCLLPTDAVLRMKSVCRAWAEIISDPSFMRAHCTRRRAPISSFFSIQDLLAPRQVLLPLQTRRAFPSMITAFMSIGFKAISTSHGLVCFIREFIVVANPVTSHWALIPSTSCSPSPRDIPYLPLFMHSRQILSSSRADVFYDRPVIIYDPTLSVHFKLVIAEYRICGQRQSRFHIYSSEASSWSVSSVFLAEGDTSNFVDEGFNGCYASRIGGGSVCWMRYNNLVGYEIASNTCWTVSLPLNHYKEKSLYTSHDLSFRDGEIYCVVFCSEGKSTTVKVERLDEAKTWVLEAEGSVMKKLFIRYRQASYDNARKALILDVGRERVTFYLSSSRIEVLDLGDSYRWMDNPPHANTLAPFHGAKHDPHALHRLLSFFKFVWIAPR